MFHGVAVTVRREAVRTKQLALSKTTKVFTSKKRVAAKRRVFIKISLLAARVDFGFGALVDILPAHEARPRHRPGRSQHLRV